jgi:hypothetical protein
MYTPSSKPLSSEPTPSRPMPRSLIAYCLERDTSLFSLKMALPIGTLLAAINHGQALLSGHFTAGELLPLCLTYCVPFAVAMYSQAQGKRQRDLSTSERVGTNEQLRRRSTNNSSSGRLLSADRLAHCIWHLHLLL